MKGFCVPAVLAGIAMACLWKTKSKKPLIFQAPPLSKILESLVSMKSAAKLFSAIQKSGKKRSIRMGRWVDFNRPIAPWTLHLWNLSGGYFKRLYKKGLVYEGYKVMPFSAS